MSHQKLSYVTAVTWPLLFALLMISAAAVSGISAYHLLRSADEPRKAQGSDFQPRMLLVTNEQHVTANIQLGYYAHGYNSSIGSLTVEGKNPGTFPVGIRYMRISFSGAKPGTKLEYSILFNQDAESYVSGEPFANARHLPQNPVSPGKPGDQVIGNCGLPENTKFAQLMFGALSVADDGSAETQVAGLLNNQHPYLAVGDTDIVNVMEFLPTASATATVGSAARCKWLFPNSPYLGGVQWHSPATLTGSVEIGRVPGRYTVQASNPALGDISSLYWEFSGPSAINYILTDNLVARDASDRLFLAGVLGALAAGFFVEFIKIFFDLRSEVSDLRERRENETERQNEKAERQRDRAERQQEREKDREALARLIADQRAVRPDLAIVFRGVRLTKVNRWLSSMFRRPR